MFWLLVLVNYGSLRLLVASLLFGSSIPLTTRCCSPWTVAGVGILIRNVILLSGVPSRDTSRGLARVV